MDLIENREEILLREVDRLQRLILSLEEELCHLKSKSYIITKDNYPKNNTHVTWDRPIGEENGY